MLIQTIINVATVISISSTMPTTIVFSEPISYTAIGKVGDFSLNTNRKKTTIVFQPIRSVAKTELIVLTEKHNYQFKIRVDSTPTESFYSVEEGAPNASYIVMKKNKDWEILEGKSSLQFKNFSNTEMTINDLIVKPNASLTLPQGSLIFLNNERLL